MASIQQLKRRIQAAQNVSKTTKAMQMIAASKMKRAQDATMAARPYVQKLTLMTQQVAGKLDDTQTHPYLAQKEISGKTLLIALAPDKGLCGGLITNLLKEFFSFGETNKNTMYVTMGKKIDGKVAHLKNEVIASFTFGTTTPTFDMVYPLAQIIDDYYMTNQVDSVKILGTEFTSLFTQTPKITNLLPITIPSEEKPDSSHLFEPSAQTILSPLLKHYLEMVIYQHLLESFVSEQGARMIAMQNATDNAHDIIDELRLEYNKTRQAKITSEILDISSGGQPAYA